jgi:hypothetical protein
VDYAEESVFPFESDSAAIIPKVLTSEHFMGLKTKTGIS